jgi:homocitrate synthase NifV
MNAMGRRRAVIRIKDSTLREGLDTPNVTFSEGQKRNIVRALEAAGVPEEEIVAPSRVLEDLEFAKVMKGEASKIRMSGLIYAHGADFEKEIEAASRHLDRFDVLVPLSEERKPYNRREKMKLVSEALREASRQADDVGAGFPHSTQVEAEFLSEMVEEAGRAGARRVTLYDTNGSSDPAAVRRLIERLVRHVDVPLFFHGHNDLGLATANSLAAVDAGAQGLDLTVNGIGDRAGNAALEQVILCLALKGFETGVRLDRLRMLSKVVEQESGVPVSKLAPVVGEYVFYHKSPSHLETPALFEAFEPGVVGDKRKLTAS